MINMELSESYDDIAKDYYCTLTPACATGDTTQEQTSNNEMRDIIGSFEEAGSSSDLPRTSTKSRPESTHKIENASKKAGVSEIMKGFERGMKKDLNAFNAPSGACQRSPGSVKTWIVHM